MKIPTHVAAILAVTFTSAVSADSRTEIDTSTPSVKFQNVSINHDGDRPMLTGKIKRRSYNSSVSPGHIDYIVVSKDGLTIDQGAIQYSPSLSLRRWKYGSSFSVLLPENLPSHVIIRVGYHRNQYIAPTESPRVSHLENTLVTSN